MKPFSVGLSIGGQGLGSARTATASSNSASSSSVAAGVWSNCPFSPIGVTPIVNPGPAVAAVRVAGVRM